MAWIVGIDEAGYGPNLGPFVMTRIACRVAAEVPEADLWEVLQQVVRRDADRCDERLLVADSKVVFSQSRGMAELETSVLAILAAGGAPVPTTLADYVEFITPSSVERLRAEPWFKGTTVLPRAADLAACQMKAERFASASATRGIRWQVGGAIICSPQFNDLLERWGSKGAILGHALGELLQCIGSLDGPEEPIRFAIDKHGGRNTYTAMLQNALAAGMVVAREEGALRSVYDILGLRRPVRLQFQPRADAEHFCVALASMVSKYLRELLMGEFNDYWLGHVPGLKPTAGYPLDAVRFMAAIRPAVQKLGFTEATLWRKK